VKVLKIAPDLTLDEKWWKDHPEWRIKYHDNDDCGFLVLEK